MERKKLKLGLAFILLLALSAFGYSGKTESDLKIMKGALDNIPEGSGNWIWADNDNCLCQQWSAANIDSSGWFYGSKYPWSNADVYVFKGSADPLNVIDANHFEYSDEAVLAYKGDTIFFKGKKGVLGAWHITNIKSGRLSGTWYISGDGNGDFTLASKEASNPIKKGSCATL